ncbi:unnamed protein product, partial [marine sediment metagenome]
INRFFGDKMKKKTVKVKRKMVKKKKKKNGRKIRKVRSPSKKGSVSLSKIKKAVKKVIALRKKTKKKKRKKQVKKRKRRKRRKATMDDIYRILNKVQIDKKKVSFTVLISDADMIENVIKDLQLIYTRKNMKTQVNFLVAPQIDKEKFDFLELDYLDDEIPEEGKIW